MEIPARTERGIVLLGCGKMGGALLDGWLAGGIAPERFTVLDPNPGARLHDLAEQGLRLNAEIPDAPAVVVVAVKPQMMETALWRIVPLGNGETVVISIAAGTPISTFESALGGETPVIRAMPNTPSSVGRGVTALIGNRNADEADMALAEALMGAVGQSLRLEREDQMDAVTAVSGSGPAYVFLMIEALAAAGEAEGLSPELALQLARGTVAGAGVLAEASDEAPAALRVNVTSPGGTTAAALEVLMDDERGLFRLLRDAVAAAAARSRALRE